jgi:hypothetical protein
MRPFLKATVTEAKLHEEGVAITVTLEDEKNKAEFEMIVGREYKAPVVGDRFTWEIPLRKRSVKS